jgi:hypothetical protein
MKELSLNITEELRLNIGAHIWFRDGAGGTLHKVVIDPQTKQVTDLVIVKGLLQRHDYVIPFSVVEQASEDEIQLALDIEDIAIYPEYREVEFEEPIDDWEHEIFYPREHKLLWNPMVGFYEGSQESSTPIVPVMHRRIPEGIAIGKEVIGRSSVLLEMNGVIGTIDQLWLDRDSWELTHLVVRKANTPGFVVIPFSWISGITLDEIFVKGTETQLQEVLDMQLHQEPTPASGIGVGDEDFPLDENLFIAEEVLDALAADPRTASSVIEIVYDREVITLMGNVESELAHAAAEEIAHQHEGVVSVVNALEVQPKPDAAQRMARVFGQLLEHGYGAVTDVAHIPGPH